MECFYLEVCQKTGSAGAERINIKAGQFCFSVLKF